MYEVRLLLVSLVIRSAWPTTPCVSTTSASHNKQPPSQTTQ